MSGTGATDPAGQMAAMGSELQNGVFGVDPADPGTGQGDATPDAEILREGEPDVENGVPSGDDAELGDRS
jgi:hypothetical protein